MIPPYYFRHLIEKVELWVETRNKLRKELLDKYEEYQRLEAMWPKFEKEIEEAQGLLRRYRIRQINRKSKNAESEDT